MTLKEAIQRLAETQKKPLPLLCEVVEVNESAGTVDVKPIDEPEFFDVRINAEISPVKGLRIIPKLGSKVFVLPINSETGIVVLTSEADKILVDCDNVVFNGGNLGGLIKIEELVQKLNNLEQWVNNFVTAFNAHAHAGNGVPPTVPLSDTLTPTQKAEIEDTKIKH